MTGDSNNKPARRTQILLWLAALAGITFSAVQMWTYYSSQRGDPVVAPKTSALIEIDPAHPHRWILQAMLPIEDPPPLTPPAGAKPDDAWILNEIRNGRVDLQWVFLVDDGEETTFAFFAKALTQKGFRQLKGRRNRFGIPTEVWRKKENIISISLRKQPKKQTIRLIIRQTRTVEPSDRKRTVPRQ
jgi:hypothetical protein